jgi:glucan endo-1,6-beta-glucosidase
MCHAFSDCGEQRRGLQQLQAAGIVAILDHHALPGVQDPGQEFTGR